MDVLDVDSREALALARYTLASTQGAESFEDIFNLGLKNPTQSIRRPNSSL